MTENANGVLQPVPQAVRESITRDTMIENGEQYEQLAFVSAEEAAATQAVRDVRWLELAAAGRVGCSGTKADVTALAPGCRRCGEGLWSCLFINSICNGACPYCPAPQRETGVPGTNLLDFPEPAAYVDYVERLGITGVSISGGEPLLTLERTVKYLAAIKRHFGARVHTWLYSNGILARDETLARLRDVGLDEIRFDVGATDYDPGAAERAVAFLPTVVVEIPLMPDDRDRVAALVPRLESGGIGFLNLHQLRVTPHNLKRLVKRGYRFVHGEKVTVLESELAILEIIAETRARGSAFPINYCSSVYKLRYQRMGHRQRAARFVARADEQVTESGFLRSGDRYVEAVVRREPSYRWPFVEVPLGRGSSIVIERRDVDPALVADRRVERIVSGLPDIF